MRRGASRATVRTAIRRTATLALFSSVLIGSLAGSGVAAQAAPAASVPQCKGEFKHAVSNVKFSVSGHEINPPYGPHTRGR